MTNMEMAKKNFERGLWTEDMLKSGVKIRKGKKVFHKAVMG